MKDFSAIRSDPFDLLEWRHVLVMLAFLRECDYMNRDYIKKRYCQQASFFEETLSFMACLRAVDKQEGYVKPSHVLRTSDEADARTWLIRHLFEFRNRYRTHIFHYLRKFRIADGEPQYRPPFSTRHRESHVRNFLMEMDVVRYDSRYDYYRIGQDHLYLYIVAQDNVHKRTPAAVAAGQRDRESLGMAAEEAIVSYERQRVGSAFADRSNTWPY